VHQHPVAHLRLAQAGERHGLPQPPEIHLSLALDGIVVLPGGADGQDAAGNGQAHGGRVRRGLLGSGLARGEGRGQLIGVGHSSWKFIPEVKGVTAMYQVER